MIDFLTWHYGSGLKFYLRRSIYHLSWVTHYFSLRVLLLTLFYPWKRLAVKDTSSGFSFERAFEDITFNFISRFVGFLTRSVLFLTGFLYLAVSLFVIMIGFIVWLIVPFLSYPFYQKYLSQSALVAARLWVSIKSNPAHALELLFQNSAGKFVAAHLNISVTELVSVSIPNIAKAKFSPTSYQELISYFIALGTWPTDFLHQHQLVFQDMVQAAKWWDRLQSSTKIPTNFGQPGIGGELLFGYTPTLDRYTQNLSAPQTFASHLIGRADLMSHLERVLSSGKNVILTGLPGVGRKTAVLEFANRAREGLLGPELSYRRVLELDYNFLLSGSDDVNTKKAVFGSILAEASAAGNIILVIRDIHRLTSPEVEKVDFTDVFEKYLESGHLKVIAISSQVDYERFVSPHSRLRKFLEPVEVVSPTRDEAFEILTQASDKWESKSPLILTTSAIRQIVDGSDKYITEIPFPEKALEILDAVVTYAKTRQTKIITVDEVDSVISEKTGISLTSLSPKQKNLLVDLEQRIHANLIGQNPAVDAVSQSLRARLVGTKDDRRPVGSFLFLGPTGVGKTQMAKTLAEIYYGSAKDILRFDMAEFQGEEGIARLIGSASRSQPGALTSAIKNHPASLLLLDEIEKSPSQIYNLFLSLLDEGTLTDAYDRKIIGRHLFVIATSNAGAEFIRQQVVNNLPQDQLQIAVLNYIQEQHIFSPEFLNRFDGVIVFSPLSETELVSVANLMLQEVATDLRKKNIILKITPEICRSLASQGFRPEFGARAMRRIVDLGIGDAIAKALLSDKVHEGDTIQINPGQIPNGFDISVL